MYLEPNEYNFRSLLSHLGHHIVCVPYGNEETGIVNISVECEECGEVICDMDKPKVMSYIPLPEYPSEE